MVDSHIQDVPIDQIVVGDEFVRADEGISVDAMITSQAAMIDEWR